MNKRAVGSKTEDEAARFLAGCGLTVIEQNFRCRFGEIDLVARDGKFTVFVEVKYRKDSKAGSPEEAVSAAKARKISKVSDYYRVVHKLPEDSPVRYDVVAIDGDTFRWYRNAFSYIR